MDKTYACMRKYRWVALSLLIQVSTGKAARAQDGSDDSDLLNMEVRTPRGPAEENLTSWNISAGGVLNTGNTRSLSTNAGSRFMFTRAMNQLSGDVQFAYGRASVQDEETPNDFEGWVTNTENLNAQLRYDRFFTIHDAIFLGSRLRLDRFAGLSLRLQGQTGYLRNLVRQEALRVWVETGYDLSYDNVHRDSNDAYIHSARGFFGYDHQLNEHVGMVVGLEGLYDVQNHQNVRAQMIVEIASKVSDTFSLNLTFTGRFDNVPVPDRQKRDTLTTLNLVMTIL